MSRAGPIIQTIGDEQAKHAAMIAALKKSSAALADLAHEKRLALLCYERVTDECHRTPLRHAMLPGFAAIDLLPPD